MRTKAKLFGGWLGLALLAAVISCGCKSSNGGAARSVAHSKDSHFEPVPGIDPVPSAGTSNTVQPSNGADAGLPGVAASTDKGAGARGNHSSGPSYERIEPGEVITVLFSDVPQPPTPQEVKVREDGTVTLLLNATFHLGGKSIMEAEREIRDYYVPKYFVNLTVSIRAQNTYYFVGGEVKSPSKQPYTGRTTVIKAIQSAGDFTDFAQKKKVKVIRLNGKVENVNALKALEKPELDIEIYPGDKIHVPRRLW
jgi:polysaccharide export outer membrane protein